jgi:hypothetical protein
MTVEELLNSAGIHLASTAAGRHYAICPQCSAKRRGPHQRDKVLGVTIDAQGAMWGCSHCGWTGPAKGNGHANGHASHVQTFDYVDEQGQLLFQKCRGANKKFWQRKPDGAGGWVNKLGDTRKVLYRLPEINEAIGGGNLVMCVEGEKDADNLWCIGIPATCNPDGASEPDKKPKWRAEYSEMLRGGDIVVMGDNDPAGRAHVEATAASLTGIAQRVRVLDLSKHWESIKPGGDISDWLDAGLTREALDELIAKAPDYAAKTVEAPAVPTKLVLTTIEFLARYVAPDYLIDGLFQRGFFYAITGATGAGKTAIALLIAVLVAIRQGQKLGDHAVEHGRVLYIVAENATDVRMRLMAKLERMDVSREEINQTLLFIETDGKNLKKDMPRIIEEVKVFWDVALVIVDTSAATFCGDDENSNPQMIAHAKDQRDLCNLPGRPTVLSLCHPIKHVTAQDQLLPRGGGAYVNETDGNFTVWPHGEKLSDLYWTGKLRGPDFEKITFKMVTVLSSVLVDSKGRPLPTVMAKIVTDEEAAENENTAIFQENVLLKAMVDKPHGSLSDWAAHCGWMPKGKPNKSMAQRVMKRLIEAKLVSKHGRGYVLTKAGQEQVKQPGTGI